MAHTQYQSAGPQPFPLQSQGFVPLAPVTADNKKKVVSSRGWYIGKIVLGGLSIVAGLVVAGLGGGLVAAQLPYPADNGYIAAAMALPPAVLAVVWQIAELLTLCIRRNRGIHPGAHVGVHLVIWLACSVAGGMIASFYSFDAEFSYWWFSDSSSSSSTQGYAAYLTFEEALAICLWPLAIINFILFVRSCIECQRRNMNRAVAKYAKPAEQMQMLPFPTTQLQSQAQTDQYQYQQYQVSPLQKTDTPSPPPQQRSYSSTPVQGPFQAQQPPVSELGSGHKSPPNPNQAIEIGGAPRYAEMAATPRYTTYSELGGDTAYASRGPA